MILPCGLALKVQVGDACHGLAQGTAKGGYDNAAGQEKDGGDRSCVEGITKLGRDF
jgi:hypothetical protein